MLLKKILILRLLIKTRKTDRENDPRAITTILLANQEHLELLSLELLYYDERDPVFLPPNLKYLCLCKNQYDDYDDQVLCEMAAEQCPKLRGVEFHDPLTIRTINAISRFEKFVAYLTTYLDYIYAAAENEPGQLGANLIVFQNMYLRVHIPPRFPVS